MIQLLLRAGRFRLLAATAVLVSLIAFADWAFGKSVSLAALYILPMMVGAVVMRSYEIAPLAVLCSYLRSLFEMPGTPADTVIRFIFAVLAYISSALFVVELVRNHKRALEHIEEIGRVQAKRQEAEEQLRLLAESSPAAIITIGAHGEVLAANRAAESLFAVARGELKGQRVRKFLPILDEALCLSFEGDGLRTAAQSQGCRSNGQIFSATTWFSTYRGIDGPRLAAIVVDMSEEMRDREEQSLQQLQHDSRIAAAAVAHEVRNFCGAMTLLCSNLDAHVTEERRGDVRRLSDLINGLESLADLDLQAKTQEIADVVTLRSVLDDLRIIIEPSWIDAQGSIEWKCPGSLPSVLADRHRLLQAFLNLTQNSLRAVKESTVRALTIEVEVLDQWVKIHFLDSGPGVTRDLNLFEPFHPSAEGSGLGLYVSRSIIRSYGGDLRHDASRAGCCFTIELQVVPDVS